MARLVWPPLPGMPALLFSPGLPADAGPAYLPEPAAVFTAADARLHPGWVVGVEGQRIAAVGPADKVVTADAAFVMKDGVIYRRAP